MSKKVSKSAQFRQWIAKIGDENVYTTDGRVIYCQACQKQAPSDRFFLFDQHNKTATHRANVVRMMRPGSSKQQLLTETTTTNVPDQFSAELCEAFLSANIPFEKINNAKLKHFLEKHIKRNVPDASTLRKNYLKVVYNQRMAQIKEKIKDKYIWASVDETTDKMGRYAANLIIGILDVNPAMWNDHFQCIRRCWPTTEPVLLDALHCGWRPRRRP